MNTNEIMKLLYDRYEEQRTSTSAYETAKELFCSAGNNETEETSFEVLTKCVYEESRQAFKAGFHTAVSLIMGGAN